MTKLPMPENIPLRWELFRGFGKKECVQTGAVTALAAILCAIVYAVTRAEMLKSLSVIVLIVVIFACVGFFGHIEQGLSIYDYIQNHRLFLQSQQKFNYRTKDEVILFVREEKNN